MSNIHRILEEIRDIEETKTALAEEVIRLREEIAGIKRFCRDGMKVSEAEARLTDHEREKCWREGRWAAYYDVFHELDDQGSVGYDENQCTSDLGWREDDVYPHHKLR